MFCVSFVKTGFLVRQAHPSSRNSKGTRLPRVDKRMRKGSLEMLTWRSGGQGFKKSIDEFLVRIRSTRISKKKKKVVVTDKEVYVKTEKHLSNPYKFLI
jgi:hypothetical protein